MIDTMLNLVFRCAHRRLTRPVTPVAKSDLPHGPTYVVCLDCGKRFAYDAKAMRIGKPLDTPDKAAVPAPPETRPPSRLRHAILAAVPAAIVFFLALFGFKRAGGSRDTGRT